MLRHSAGFFWLGGRAAHQPGCCHVRRHFAANHFIMVPDCKLLVAANSKHSQPQSHRRGLLAYGCSIALETLAVLVQFLDGAV